MKIKSFKPKLHKQIQDTRAQSLDNRNINQPKLSVPSSNYSGKTLRVIPLGGVGVVQKNMFVYEYGDDIIIVDCGVGFPDEGMPGVDLVIPDISYLKDKKAKLELLLLPMLMKIILVGFPIFGQN